MPSSRPLKRLGDILENIERIQFYTSGMDWAAYSRDGLVQDGAERCLQRISEAATKLGSFAEREIPNQRWQEIRGLGNLLRHAYDVLEPYTIWSIIEKNLPELQKDVAAALARLRDNAS